MVYQYHCERCDDCFDVVKPARDYERIEICDKCGEPAKRDFVPTVIYLSGTKVEDAEYNPGLGCIVKNKKHRAEIAKQKGLIEIGNEKPETLHKYYDKVREENREKAWASVDKGWVGNE